MLAFIGDQTVRVPKLNTITVMSRTTREWSNSRYVPACSLKITFVSFLLLLQVYRFLVIFIVRIFFESIDLIFHEKWTEVFFVVDFFLLFI